jgi:transposase
MKVLHIIGADLSKKSVDLFCYQFKSYLQIENSYTGFQELQRWLKRQKIKKTDVMIVMEHTGLYSYHLEAFLHKHQIRFTKVSALAIKRSLGLVRGKNDKLDAQRIARYGYEKRDCLVATLKPDPTLERLQMLHSTRERLVRQRASLLCAVKEYKAVLSQSDAIIKSQLALIKNFTQQIKTIESEIKIYIAKEQGVNDNYKLLTSVKGVGKVVATATIVKTRNFTLFTDPRKFACYCGTAPFEHSSGKSIRRRTKVSHLADKEMKTLLDQSAKSAIQYDKELKKYYQRRIEMGKSKKSTINIVRNKILYRMFAVVKRQTPFVENYLQSA